MGFFDDYGAGIGGALGLLPALYQNLFGSSASGSTPTTNVTNDIRNPWNMASLPGGGLSPNGYPLSTTQGQQDQAAANNPNTSPMNVVKQTPEQLMSAANTGTTDKSSDLMKALSGLGNTFSGGGANKQGPMVPAVPPQPAGGGGGPNAALLQALSPNAQMLSQKLPSGAPGAPLGPAVLNPLLAMLRNRLGVV
jgi:hypothetical protein